MKKFENVRSIKFKVSFEGNGCVNYDSSEQKTILMKIGLIDKPNNNVMFAKKEFLANGGYRYKVSADCIRHNMFPECAQYDNPLIMNMPHVFYRAISSAPMLERGYMYAGKEKTFNRKTICTLTDAIERDERRFLHQDVGVHSGEKTSTSYYFKDNVGEITYYAKGFINLCEAQFVSSDIRYDRDACGLEYGVVDANARLYFDVVKEEFPSMKDVSVGYYYRKNAFVRDEWGEQGILLDRESVSAMAKDVLKRLFNVEINRAKAMFKTKTLTVTVVMDGGVEETFEIKSEKEIDGYYFGYCETYIQADYEKTRKNKEEYDAMKKKFEEEIKKQKEAEKSKGGKGRKSDDGQSK